MSENSSSGRSPLGVVLLFLLVIVLPVGLGIYFAPDMVPKPQVGVIRLYDAIDPFTASIYKEQINYARENEEIEALVIVINSPGGTASDSEELFLELLDIREDMPVVASVDFLAASGAYYTAVGADEIYAKTSSLIGSIGVRGSLIIPPFLDPTTITTGPYKDAGFTPDSYLRRIETLKFAFLDAVATGRGERLEATTETLSRAELFDGIRSDQMGMIDGIASTDDAIKRAAELAGIRDYDVVELFPLAFPEEADAATYSPPVVDLNSLWVDPNDLPPGFYYLYAPGQ